MRGFSVKNIRLQCCHLAIESSILQPTGGGFGFTQCWDKRETNKKAISTEQGCNAGFSQVYSSSAEERVNACIITDR